MNKLFFDIETTGLNPYTAEILTGCFILLDKENNYIDEYEFKSQVDTWSESAEKIHKISFSESSTYPSKRQALDGFTRWLSGLPLFECYLFANPNTELGYLFYDVATLQMQLMNYLNVNRVEQQPFAPQKIISVYTLAKDLKDYYTPVKNTSGRASYSQPNVYKALFNESYDAHNAKADVMAMIRIYNKLIYLKENNLKQQLDLF